MLSVPSINVVRLISLAALLITAFIATTLLIYGASDPSACPKAWKRNNYGDCLNRMSGVGRLQTEFRGDHFTIHR
jgi:hypothetical protein